jgi:hypothetical protein
MDFSAPPRFGADQDSLVLLDFSVASGTKIADVSGKNHHGLFPAGAERNGTVQWVRVVGP